MNVFFFSSPPGFGQRNLSVGVFVIDFFNQKVNGDFEMNPVCYPDPRALATEVHDQTGAQLMVSIWPNIEASSRCAHALIIIYSH